MLVALTLIGAALRARELTTGGFFSDDAWVALSSKVGLGTAWHMWATTPGFDFVLRTIMGIGPRTSWWAQLLPFALGVAAVPLLYWAARRLGLGVRAGLALAAMICINQIAIIYSGRLKEYSADFVLSCVLVVLAEAVRRRPERKEILTFGLVSVGAFATSATLGLAVAGLWIGAVLPALRRPGTARRVVGATLAIGAACAGVAGLFYRHLSPSLANFWRPFTISTASPHWAWVTTVNSAYRFYYHAVNLPFGGSEAMDITVLSIAFAIWLLGATSGPAMRGPALVLVLAFAASAAHISPLGTGRTDEYLFPVALVCGAFGARRVWRWVAPRASAVRTPLVVAACTLWCVIALFGFGSVPTYPVTDVGSLATAIARQQEPGDHIVVGEVLRYPWAYYEDAAPHIVLGPDWSAGFTVRSTKSDTFIAPSEDYELDSHPVRWAAAMAPYHRLWFVYPTSLASNPLYGALVADGWHGVETIHGRGCGAILLERTA
ncbi:MAG TPA: hypothetical protein VL961_04575 [Acidimicrobiales bacterium]|nr:hypothetical protein [Acidimicrobiales bacterium]